MHEKHHSRCFAVRTKTKTAHRYRGSRKLKEEVKVIEETQFLMIEASATYCTIS